MKRKVTKRAKPRNKIWVDAEVAALKRMFRNSPNVRLAKLMGRTPSSIRDKARALGLKKSQRYLKAQAASARGAKS